MSAKILITGAGTGLGLEAALYLAKKGFIVYATIPDSSQRQQVETQAARRGVQLRILPLDLTDRASIDTAVGTITGQDGSLYGVINNAGISLRGYFEDCESVKICVICGYDLLITSLSTVLPDFGPLGSKRCCLN